MNILKTGTQIHTLIAAAIALKHPEDYGNMADKINNLPKRRKKKSVKLLNHLSAKRRPGILDRIASCESASQAHLMWHEFLDDSNDVSQKTINKAKRLLSTLDFPLE